MSKRLSYIEKRTRRQPHGKTDRDQAPDWPMVRLGHRRRQSKARRSSDAKFIFKRPSIYGALRVFSSLEMRAFVTKRRLVAS